MSTQIFPALPGLAFNIARKPIWFSKKQVSVAGLETALSYWSYPRWQWELSYDVLRSSSAYLEFQTLAGFFNARQGGFDSFLYADTDDNSVTGQAIGTGDGTTTSFQLVRSLGGFNEPMLAPNTAGSINIYLNGVKQSSGYSLNGWGTSQPGLVVFTTAPTAGVAITADFSFYFPCRFNDDQLSFTLFMSQMYSGEKVAFTSLKGMA